MVTCFITFDDLSGHSYPFSFLMFLNFLFVQFLCKAVSYHVYAAITMCNKLLLCHMFMQQSFMYTVCVLSYHTQNI